MKTLVFADATHFLARTGSWLRQREARNHLLAGTCLALDAAATTRPCWTGIAIAFVYTPPGRRGKGDGAAISDHVTRAMFARGWRRCWLFADLANPVSNRIYTRLGYRPLCDFYEFVF